MNSKYQTLHAHTLTSDGNMSYREVFENANTYGFGAIAFTDHDSLPNEEALKYLDSQRSNELKWIIGTEISAGLPPESGGGHFSGLHVIGLFVDPRDKALLEHSRASIAERLERMKVLVTRLSDLGFEITEEACLKASGGEVIGKPHIVEALKSFKKNEMVMKELVEKVRKQTESDTELKIKFDDMIASGEYQYPYRLFLSSDAMIKGVYYEGSYSIDLDASVKMIRNAGGLAVIAHYFTAQQKITPDLLEVLLRDDRIDGIETTFGLWEYGTEKWDKMITSMELTEKLALKYNKIQTGGVDLHREEDFKKFVEVEPYAQRTIGMVEKVIEISKVDTKWSSF
ncbi:MAG: PHP domain-containing protein [bacterium]|nr:PHP domain-containing protein [bacterium]